MGVSTDGEICFGIVLDDGYELPWHRGGYDGDAEEWWVGAVLKKTYNEYSELKEILTADPMPFEVVNYCSGEYPMYILAVPGTLKTASRGYPQVFNPSELVVSEEQIKKFLDFCEEHIFFEENQFQATWILSSYMG